MNARKIFEPIRIAMLGASRGLGWALYQELLKNFPKGDFFLSSRKILENKSLVSEKTVCRAQDFSKLPMDINFIDELQKFNPTHIVYVAGGGPYGLFNEKSWQSHQWALNTTFLYPAQLLHSILSNTGSWTNLKQILFVGSSIAESKPDPKAASYASAKHGLKGLVESVQIERGQTLPKVSLFSPGYMQTEMIPINKEVYGLAEKPEVVARQLITCFE